MSDTGGSAFPIVGDYGRRMENSEGMTLRDYFAAKALPLAASLDAEYRGEKKSLDMEYVAALAYAIADAMLKARKS